jgi:hypothetical protein
VGKATSAAIDAGGQMKIVQTWLHLKCVMLIFLS